MHSHIPNKECRAAAVFRLAAFSSKLGGVGYVGWMDQWVYRSCCAAFLVGCVVGVIVVFFGLSFFFPDLVDFNAQRWLAAPRIFWGPNVITGYRTLYCELARVAADYSSPRKATQDWVGLVMSDCCVGGAFFFFPFRSGSELQPWL